MKRICYLLVWLLTGFTLAANENSYQNSFLLCDGQTATIYQVRLDSRLPARTLLAPRIAAAQEELSQAELTLNQRFICSIE